MDITTIGFDIAKGVFQVHGVDGAGEVTLRRRLSRGQVLALFERLPRCLVGMEACGSAHHWARAISALGHDVRLIAPAYVKPYVKRSKTDAADAAAICEAVSRPHMRFVPIKTPDDQALALPETPTSSCRRSRHRRHGPGQPRGPRWSRSAPERPSPPVGNARGAIRSRTVRRSVGCRSPAAS